MAGTRDPIRRGLAEVWETQGRRFVTFEARDPDRDGADVWIQYLDGELNVAWPFDEDPRAVLTRRGVALPPGAFVSWHAAASNAVFAVGDVRLDDVASFVDALFAKVLADGPPRAIDVRVDDHG